MRNTLTDAGCGADTGDLGPEEACRYAGRHKERCKPVVVRNRGANCVSGNLGTEPLDGVGDRRVIDHAEVESLVGVFPDILSVDHQVLAERLREAGMEFIAVTRAQGRCRYAGAARDGRLERDDHRVEASLARDHEVFVERALHSAGIGNTQNGAGRLDVVSDTEARFRLRGAGKAIVCVDACAQIERPVVDVDCVHYVERKFLDIGMAVVVVIPAGIEGTAIGSGQRRRPGQVVTGKNRDKARILIHYAARTGVRVGKRGIRIRTSVGIQTRRIRGRIDQTEAISFREESVLVLRTDFYVVHAFYVRQAGTGAGIGEPAILARRGGLQIGREIGKRIIARIIVVLVLPHPAAEREHAVGIENMSPHRRYVKRSDLRTLIRRAHR